MPNIIVKNYTHFNRALGKFIRNKSEYDYEMKSRGFVPYEEGCQLADNKNKEKQWKPSDKVINMIKNTKDLADKKGNIVLGQHPKLVDAMKKQGISFEMPDWLPKHYQEKGGLVNDG